MSDTDKHIIDLPNTLKEKAGTNDQHSMLAIKEADMFIKNNDIDFKPMARRHLKLIDADFKELKESEDTEKREALLETIIENIMQIKAHGGMFHYQIMSDIAGIVLNFLDTTTEMNNDIFQIIEAHNNSIRIIIKRNIRGDGGILGKELIDELSKATKRYQKKYSNK